MNKCVTGLELKDLDLIFKHVDGDSPKGEWRDIYTPQYGAVVSQGSCEVVESRRTLKKETWRVVPRGDEFEKRKLISCSPVCLNRRRPSGIAELVESGFWGESSRRVLKVFKEDKKGSEVDGAGQE